MKQVSFVAKTSGDGECFCWDDLSNEDKAGVVGDNEYDAVVDLYQDDLATEEEVQRMIDVDWKRLYPDTLMSALEVQEGRKYRFTVSVEEVP